MVAVGCSCPQLLLLFMVVVLVYSGRGVGLLAEVAPQLVPSGKQLLSKPAIIAIAIDIAKGVFQLLLLLLVLLRQSQNYCS